MKPHNIKNYNIDDSSATRKGILFTYLFLFVLLFIISLIRAKIVHSSTGTTPESHSCPGLIHCSELGSLHFYIPLVVISLFIIISFFSLHAQLYRKNNALRMSEEKFRLIFEHSPLGILHFDGEGVITACNPAFEKIVGTSREKILGIDLKTLPDIRISQTIKQVLSGNTGTFENEYSSVTSKKSGPIRALFAPLSRSNGIITGGIGIIEDITLLKLNEVKLVHAREEAEKANRIKSIFLANMSHEVRTPLNGILGLLQILRKTSSDPGQHEYIDMALRSGERLTRLLRDILDLTKIESEQFSLIKEQVNISDMLNSIREALYDECDRKQINISCTVSESVPEVITGDELRIRQVVQNLAENSVKFTSEGSISIEADFIFSGKTEGSLILKVRDTGIGIEADKLNEIIEPFRQVENTYTRKFQGAGLGLAIVKKLASLMDGDLKIESIPGSGTGARCTMKVEVFEDNQNRKSEQSADESAVIHSLKILLVEDDRINSLMVRRLLEKMSHVVTDAANGLDALQCIKENDFDLVLMDIQMPEMNGIEAIKEIRKTERFGQKSGVCAIALTAYAMAGDREKFISEGFDEYMPKPVDMEELNTVILRLNPLGKS